MKIVKLIKIGEDWDKVFRGTRYLMRVSTLENDYFIYIIDTEPNKVYIMRWSPNVQSERSYLHVILDRPINYLDQYDLNELKALCYDYIDKFEGACKI